MRIPICCVYNYRELREIISWDSVTYRRHYLHVRAWQRKIPTWILAK